MFLGHFAVGFGAKAVVPRISLVGNLFLASHRPSQADSAPRRPRTGRNRAGRWELWAMVTTLAGIYLANLFGPPPPSVTAIAWVGQLQGIFVAWGYWLPPVGRRA